MVEYSGVCIIGILGVEVDWIGWIAVMYGEDMEWSCFFWDWLLY